MKRMIFAFVALMLCVASVFATPCLQITEPSVTQAGNEGTDVTLTFHVTNACAGPGIDVDLTFDDILKLGTRSFSGPAIPGIIGLVAGGSETINVDVTIPANQFGGDYTTTITADDGTTTDTTDVTVTVNEVPEFTLSPATSTVSIPHGFSGSTTVTISNTGNTDLEDITFAFNSLGTIPSTAFSVPVTQLNIPDNGAASRTITIAVPAGTTPGVYTGTYRVSETGGEYKDGTLTVTVTEPLAHLATPTELKYENLIREDTESKSFTITNDGDIDLTNVQATSSLPTSWNAGVSGAPTTIAAGASATITVEFTVPEGLQNSLNEDLGVIAITSDQYNVNIPFKAEAKTMLELNKLYVYVNGKRNRVDEGDTVDIEPEDVVVVKANLENVYDEDVRVDIEEVLMTVTIYEIDDGDDLEEESDEVTIDPEENEDVEVSFDIPLEVEEDSFEMEILIEAQDENGVDYDFNVVIDLDLEKEKDDVRIITFAASKDTLRCETRLEFDVELMNIGTNDNDEVMYVIDSSALGIDIQQGGPGRYLDLESDPFDSDNSYTRMHTVSLPLNTKPGSYTVTMDVYVDRDELKDSQDVLITVLQCNEFEDEDEVVDDEIDVITPPVITPPTEPSGPVIATGGNAFDNQWVFIALLAGVAVILLIIVISIGVRRN